MSSSANSQLIRLYSKRQRTYLKNGSTPIHITRQLLLEVSALHIEHFDVDGTLAYKTLQYRIKIRAKPSSAYS